MSLVLCCTKAWFIGQNLLDQGKGIMGRGHGFCMVLLHVLLLFMIIKPHTKHFEEKENISHKTRACLWPG